MTDQPTINPYAVPGTAPTKPPELPPDHPKRKKRFRMACAIQLLIMLIALGLEAIDVETIVGTGPIYFIAGICTIIFARRERNLAGALVGGSAIALTLSILFVINFFGWGPPEADWPVTVIIWSYALIATPLMLYLLFRRRSSDTMDSRTN